MKVVGVREEDTENEVRWRLMSRCFQKKKIQLSVHSFMPVHLLTALVVHPLNCIHSSIICLSVPLSVHPFVSLSVNPSVVEMMSTYSGMRLFKYFFAGFEKP
ncbi:hypothetical protein XENOCAPTIV_030776 [Xenoophorus captivus]|uniref:Uncharacterized protein n=1 Tax=Xenoophorus captivus TaxID=1517983 RepID=A0ABV0RXU2_9TELE